MVVVVVVVVVAVAVAVAGVPEVVGVEVLVLLRVLEFFLIFISALGGLAQEEL